MALNEVNRIFLYGIIVLPHPVAFYHKGGLPAMDKRVNGLRHRWMIFLIPGIVLSAVYAIMKPWSLPKLISHARPAENYDEAIRRIDALRAKEEVVALNPLCRLQLMTHDRKTDRAIILVHGYTSCPQQFHELGRRFYDLGDNVLIAPLPHHGFADRMNADQARLQAGELAAYADRITDIAQGLGEKVVMIGISAGGVTTAWAAQNRRDIERAVIISPAFGFKAIPVSLTAAVMNIYAILPDSWTWWDEQLKESVPPPYAYPRYSRHALTEILRLGFVVQQDAKRFPPAAKKIVMVFNPNDASVSNERTMKIVGLWKAQDTNLDTFAFDAFLHLGHDLIDPSQPDQQIDIVYPKLIELCGE